MTFVDSPDTQQGMPPWEFPGMTQADFVLAADLTLLQAYCDRVLNLDPRHQFRAVLPYVHIGINQYPRMYSVFGDNRDLGFTSQNEYYVMFAAVRLDLLGSIQVPHELTWVFPFLGVDNPTSAISGHAVLGFPKLCGEIAATVDVNGVFSATADMPGFQLPRTTDSPQEILPLLNIQSGPPLPKPAGSQFTFPWTFLGLQKDAGDLDALAGALLALVEPGLFSVTNLKQFRDGADPQNACYQALVRAEWRMGNIQAPTYYDGAQISISDNATNRIVSSLGVGGGQDQPFAAEFAMSLTTDMWFGNVTNLLVLT